MFAEIQQKTAVRRGQPRVIIALYILKCYCGYWEIQLEKSESSVFAGGLAEVVAKKTSAGSGGDTRN